MIKKVTVRNLEETTVASIRRNAPVWKIGEIIQELMRFCVDKNINITGNPIAVYYDKEFKPEDTDLEVCLPVASRFVPEGEVRSRILPGGKVVTLLHEGGFDRIGESYQKVAEWIEEEGYRVIGPPREVYIEGPESGKAPSTFRIEIQFPVL